jgi:hypothetical protein
MSCYITSDFQVSDFQTISWFDYHTEQTCFSLNISIHAHAHTNFIVDWSVNKYFIIDRSVNECFTVVRLSNRDGNEVNLAFCVTWSIGNQEN